LRFIFSSCARARWSAGAKAAVVGVGTTEIQRSRFVEIQKIEPLELELTDALHRSTQIS
jgi:hypothetical protein